MLDLKKYFFRSIFKNILVILNIILNLLKNLFDFLFDFLFKISPVIISFVFFFIQYQLLIKYDQKLSIYQPQCLVIGISSFYCWAISNKIKHLPLEDVNFKEMNNEKIEYIDEIHEKEKRALYFFGFIHFVCLCYFIIKDYPDLLTGSKLWWKLNLIIVGLVYIPAVLLCIGFFTKKKIDLLRYFK